jgi:putative transposase
VTILSHKIELRPTPSQVQSLARAVGCARFAWNWGLAEWNRRYEAHRTDPTLPKPNLVEIKREWSRVKHVQFPWLADSPANANLQPFDHLGIAFNRFFQKKARHPRFKQKGLRDSFYVDNQKMKLDAKRVRLPKIGRVRLSEPLRFEGKVLRGVVCREADRWFLAVAVEVTNAIRSRTEGGVIGVDLGLTQLATLSTGEEIANPRTLEKRLKRLRRLQRQHARKRKGSQNRIRSVRRIAKMHWKVKNSRKDVIHKFTTRLCRENQTVVIEDLNIRGMVKNRKLARAISDVGWGEIRRQFEYKAVLCGTKIIVADRFFPSSKRCSRCGSLKADLVLSERVYVCAACGLWMGRDLNAALNLRTLGLRGSDACGECGRPVGSDRSAAFVEAGSRLNSQEFKSS